MAWMDGQLDKVQNKTRCSCGEKSVHGVYSENVKIGEYCEDCFVTYLKNEYPDCDYLRIKKEISEIEQNAQHRLHQTAGRRGSKKSKLVVPAAGKA